MAVGLQNLTGASTPMASPSRSPSSKRDWGNRVQRLLEKLSLGPKIHVALRQRLSSPQPLSILPKKRSLLPEVSILLTALLSENIGRCTNDFVAAF
jgi:hypothetical protein